MPKGPIENKSHHGFRWWHGVKPLSEPELWPSLLMHKCLTQPQWLTKCDLDMMSQTWDNDGLGNNLRPNADFMSTGTCEIWLEIIFIQGQNLKMLSATWQPFCSGLNILKTSLAFQRVISLWIKSVVSSHYILFKHVSSWVSQETDKICIDVTPLIVPMITKVNDVYMHPQASMC